MARRSSDERPLPNPLPAGNSGKRAVPRLFPRRGDAGSARYEVSRLPSAGGGGRHRQSCDLGQAPRSDFRGEARLGMDPGALLDLLAEEPRRTAPIDPADQLTQHEAVGHYVVDRRRLAAEPVRLGGEAAPPVPASQFGEVSGVGGRVDPARGLVGEGVADRDRFFAAFPEFRPSSAPPAKSRSRGRDRPASARRSWSSLLVVEASALACRSPGLVSAADRPSRPRGRPPWALPGHASDAPSSRRPRSCRRRRPSGTTNCGSQKPWI